MHRPEGNSHFAKLLSDEECSSPGQAGAISCPRWTVAHKVAFVRAFVPLDLDQKDMASFLTDLQDGNAWEGLIAEIRAIAEGNLVISIAGDQVNKAMFSFEHPIHQGMDREVAFICTQGEWRAEA